MRKSKFFTFMFAMLPGAGQMYQGLMKRGISFMLTFLSVIAFAVFMNLPELVIILPVIWFYAFFDCMNKSSYTIDDLAMVEDKMIFNFKFDEELIKKYNSQKNALLGSVIILLGALLLYKSIIFDYIWRLEKYLPGISQVARKLPVLFLSVVVILAGIRLVKGPKTDKAGEKPYEE